MFGSPHRFAFSAWALARLRILLRTIHGLLGIYLHKLGPMYCRSEHCWTSLVTLAHSDTSSLTKDIFYCLGIPLPIILALLLWQAFRVCLFVFRVIMCKKISLVKGYAILPHFYSLLSFHIKFKTRLSLSEFVCCPEYTMFTLGVLSLITMHITLHGMRTPT